MPDPIPTGAASPARRHGPSATLALLICTAAVLFGPFPALSQIPDFAAGMPGALPVQEGTWVYPVRAGLQEAMLEGEEISTSNGIDGDFLARASVRAAWVAAGEPPTCPQGGYADMRGRTRIVAMTAQTGSGPFMGVNQRSRLVVNQELEQAVLYVHGEARSWVPGPNYCDDRQMMEDGGGRGFLRLEYRTTAHVAPLNFLAFPRAVDVESPDLEEVCRAMGDLALDAYQDMNRRWNTINHSFSGPIDWSVITPVPEGFGNGERGSFGEGTLTAADVVHAAGQAADAVSMGRELGQIFAQAPTLARGAGGAAQWAAVQSANYLLGTQIGDPVDTMLEMAKAGDAAFRHSPDPAARAVSRHASLEVQHGPGVLHGLDADYLMHTLLEACANLDPQDMPEGDASGHFSWPGGTVVLSGRGLTPGEPAAVAAGPVGTGSIAQALEMARQMGVAMPDTAGLGASLPAGISLDAMPAPMSGRAGGGGTIVAGAPEWTVSFSVELVDDGERIAALWFDPMR